MHRKPLGIFSTVKKEKLAYLQTAIVNNIQDATIVQETGEMLSRLIRDISLGEVKALLHHFQFEGICITDITPEGELPPNTLCVLAVTSEARTVEGLIQLGLPQSHVASWDMTRCQWNPIGAKLIALLQEPKKRKPSLPQTRTLRCYPAGALSVYRFSIEDYPPGHNGLHYSRRRRLLGSLNPSSARAHSI